MDGAFQWAYVYVLECRGYYKIGFSNDPRKRCKKLGTGSPVPIRVVYKLRTPFYREIEQTIHTRLHGKRRRGEWFLLDESDLDYIRDIDWDGGSKKQTAEEQAFRDSPEGRARVEAAIARINEILG